MTHQIRNSITQLKLIDITWLLTSLISKRLVLGFETMIWGIVYQRNTSIAKKHPPFLILLSNQIKIIKVMWPWTRVFTKYDYVVCLSGKRLDRDVWKVFWRQSNNPSAIQAKVGFFPLNYFRRFPLKSVRAFTSFGIQFYRDGSICSVCTLFKDNSLSQFYFPGLFSLFLIHT